MPSTFASSARRLKAPAARPAEPPVHLNPKVNGRAALAVALVSLLGYVLKLAPSVTGGDSGELIVAARDLGVAHPPGYPLWTLLAHAFTWLPLQNTAWRVALFSATSSAGAAACLCAATNLFTGCWWAGVFAAGMFAFSPLTWEYATQGEVFALNNLLLAALLLVAVGYHRGKRPGWFSALGLLSGLAVSNHHTSIFVIAPLVAATFLHGQLWRPAGWRVAVLGVAWGLVGLLPYLYLPMAAKWSSAVLVWSNPDSFGGLLNHFLRREYGTFQLASGQVASKVDLGRLLSYYFSTAAFRLLFVTLPLAALGVMAGVGAAGFKELRYYALALVAALALYLGVFQAMVNLSPSDPLLAGVLARFYLLPDLLICFFAGVGLFACVQIVPRSASVFITCAIVIPLGQLAYQGTGMLPHGRVVESYGRALLRELPPNAILLVQGDLPSNAARYVQQGDSFRSDVLILDQELLTRPWYVARLRKLMPSVVFPNDRYFPGVPDGFSLESFYEANAARHSIWIYPEAKAGDPTAAKLSFWPSGFPIQLLKLNERPPDLTAWDADCARKLASVDTPFKSAATNFPAGSWERISGLDYWSAVHRLAYTWMTQALADPSDQTALDRAEARYLDYLAAAAGPTWYGWKNLGIIYERKSYQVPAVKPRMFDAFRHYLATAPAEEADRKVIAAALADYDRAR